MEIHRIFKLSFLISIVNKRLLKNKRMETHYDKEANVLLIRISNNKPEYGEDVGKGIVVHFDKNKNPVEIEILDAKKYLADWVGQALEVKEKHKVAA